MLAVALSACGGGGTTTTTTPPTTPPPPPPPADVDLSDVAAGFAATAGTVRISAGQSRDHGDIEFSCAASGDDCVVMVMVDSDGDITATSTGGTVTAMNSDAFQESLTTRDVGLSSVTAGFEAEDGTVRIDAGESEVHGDIEFSCAAGRYDCVIMVMVDSDGDITATSTGGTVTAMNSAAYQESLTTRDVDLSSVTSGFEAEGGTVTIEAGEKKVHGDIEFSCAAGRYDCVIMVSVDSSGTITATKIGGTVTAMNAPGYPPPPGKENVDLSDVTVGFLADAIMMLEIEAGESEDHGDIRFSCASGGEDCVVMVMLANDGTDHSASDVVSGGEVTASDAGDPNTLADQKLRRTRINRRIIRRILGRVSTGQTDGVPDGQLWVSWNWSRMPAVAGHRRLGLTMACTSWRTPAMGMNPAIHGHAMSSTATRTYETPRDLSEVVYPARLTTPIWGRRG